MNFCQSYFDIILVARCEVISDNSSFFVLEVTFRDELLGVAGCRVSWKVIEYS